MEKESELLTEALQHIRGIGPARLQQLADLGIRSWDDATREANRIPGVLRNSIVEEVTRCRRAVDEDDVSYFVETLAAPDKWRILHHYLDRLSWFDIETTGLEFDDRITTIVCWHKDELHTFVEDENLDDFLDLLEEIELLVSFNGSTFDVPRVLDGFHIPDLPCPHIDLRWLCYHAQLSGGLKQITTTLGLKRPIDLTDADGSLAVELWSRWQHQQDEDARRLLIRYCAADVLLMVPLTQHLARRDVVDVETLWPHLPATSAVPQAATPLESRRQELAAMFGAASPSRMRTRRRR